MNHVLLRRTVFSITIISSILSIAFSYSAGRSFLFPLFILLIAITVLSLYEASQKRKIKGDLK